MSVRPMDTWYRYEDVRYSPSSDEYDFPIAPPRTDVVLRKFSVIKVTPKGVWLNGRFVLRDARKRYACPTEDEARVSFLARKTKQLRILRKQVEHVEQAIALINKRNGLCDSLSSI